MISKKKVKFGKWLLKDWIKLSSLMMETVCFKYVYQFINKYDKTNPMLYAFLCFIYTVGLTFYMLLFEIRDLNERVLCGMLFWICN